MYYAQINDGKLLGFYNSEIHTNIPEGSVELTMAQYTSWVSDTSLI